MFPFILYLIMEPENSFKEAKKIKFAEICNF